MLLALIGVAIPVVLYFILRQSRRAGGPDTVASIVGTDAGFTNGVFYGPVIGIVCTGRAPCSVRHGGCPVEQAQALLRRHLLLVGTVFAFPT